VEIGAESERDGDQIQLVGTVAKMHHAPIDANYAAYGFYEDFHFVFHMQNIFWLPALKVV
jgi:hypothetical protein